VKLEGLDALIFGEVRERLDAPIFGEVREWLDRLIFGISGSIILYQHLNNKHVMRTSL